MQPFPKFLLAILLAHLLADFPLQTSSMVEGKGRGSRAYLAHGGIHFLVLLLCIATFTGLQWLGWFWLWIAVGVYIGLHLAIDRAKQGLVSTKKLADSTSVFMVEQLLHLSTIVVLAWLLTRPGWTNLKSEFVWSPATGERVLEAAVVYVAVVFAGGYWIRYLTSGLIAGIEKPGESPEQIRNAGMYIGWLERFLVVTAIVVQSPSIVGLILAGKSIARFPELKERFAEYFLIGTLLSIGLAVLGGLILVKLWYGTISLR